MKNETFIVERFEKEIVLHALRVLYTSSNSASLILAIDGPAGEGKTYQCKLVLERMGIKVFSMSAGQFESKDAGEPAKLVKKTYEDAAKYMRDASTNAAALLIDDADVALGNWGENYQYTVNTQNVIGELMNLADAPVKKEEPRIPIFMTGNDLKRLYYPLRRSGRMNFFYWEPTQNEKLKMIYNLFNKFTIEDCKNLLDDVNIICKESNLRQMPISFYSDLESYKYDDDLWKQYCQIKKTCFSGKIVANISNSKNETNLTIDKIKNIARKHIEQIVKAENDYIEKKSI